MGGQGSKVSTEVGDVLPGWRMVRGESAEHENIAVLEHDPSLYNEHLKKAASNAASRLRVLRHPSILRFLWEQEDIRGLSVVVEPVLPLSSKVKELTADDVCLGFFHILTALDFLHERCGLCHNNICKNAIFVSDEDHGWRLGGFEFSYPVSSITHKSLIATIDYRAASSIPPEVCSCLRMKSWTDGPQDSDPKSSISFSRDIYAFCNLVALTAGEELRAQSPLLSSFVATCQRIVSGHHTNRPTATALLREPIFTKDPLVHIVSFLDYITVQTVSDKLSFFSNFTKEIGTLSQASIANHVVKRIMRESMFAENGFEACFRQVLTPLSATNPNGVIASENFERYARITFGSSLIANRVMLPEIETLLKSKNGRVRKLVLQTFPLFCPTLSSAVCR